MQIHVCPLRAVDELIALHRPSHLVTLINDETMIPTPRDIVAGNHLKLGMNDIATPMDGLVPPGAAHVEDLIAFARGWNRQAPMLIHCWAGISRSTAAAFVTLCALNPQVAEHEVALTIRSASPTASPNPRIVALADTILKRQGRMVAAIETIGRGTLASEGVVFSLPADLEHAEHGPADFGR